MSFTHDTKIAVKFNSFYPLLSEIDKQVEIYNSSIEDYNDAVDNSFGMRVPIKNLIREEAVIKTDNKNYYIIEIYGVKMDSYYPDARILFNALDKVCDEDYNLYQVGEDGAVTINSNYNEEELPWFNIYTEIVAECNSDKEVEVKLT